MPPTFRTHIAGWRAIAHSRAGNVGFHKMSNSNPKAANKWEPRGQICGAVKKDKIDVLHGSARLSVWLPPVTRKRETS